MRRFVCYNLLLALIGSCQAKSQIISSPEIISAYTSQAVMMKCQIVNPKDGVVSWSSVTYNFKIYQGNQSLTNDIKYSMKIMAGITSIPHLISQAAMKIVRFQEGLRGRQGGQMYNLQILNVAKSDEGYYKCGIEGTDQQIITQLNVLDRPSILLPERSGINVTDCCLAEGVTQSCLAVCYPSQIDIQEFSLPTHCGTVENLKGLSKCFSRGSNHDNCCLNMKVDAFCLDICHNMISNNLSTEYFSRCYNDINIKGIFSCFEIGYKSFPSEPTMIKAVSLCEALSGTILVNWSAPIKNPEMVTGYKIMYKSRMQETFNSVLVKTPKVYQYYLNKTENMILTDMDYKIQVSALADQGVSQESLEVDVYVPNCTLPDKNNESIIVRPTNLMAIQIENSEDVLLTWDMDLDDFYSSFIVFYKTQSASQYIAVSDISTMFYKLTYLKPLTGYTAYVVACGEEHLVCKQSLDVSFMSGTSTDSSENTHMEGDDDRTIKIAIAVGVSVSVICLTAIVLFVAIFVHKVKLLPSRKKDSMYFDNPDFHSSETVKPPAVVDKCSYDQKSEI